MLSKNTNKHVSQNDELFQQVTCHCRFTVLGCLIKIILNQIVSFEFLMPVSVKLSTHCFILLIILWPLIIKNIYSMMVIFIYCNSDQWHCLLSVRQSLHGRELSDRSVQYCLHHLLLYVLLQFLYLLWLVCGSSAELLLLNQVSSVGCLQFRQN